MSRYINSPSPMRWHLLALLAMLVGCTTTTGPSSDPVAQDPGPVVPPAPPPQSPAPTYRFGAKFEPPIGRVVHGVGQWESYNAKYTTLLPSSLNPASELVFVDIGDTPRGWEPAMIAARFAGIDASGRIPSLNISLRGLQPSAADLAKLPSPLYGIDIDIANSTKYDSRINDLIQLAKDFRKPIMLRIGGEFSGPWNGYHPYEYPKAFRKIVTMFRQAGANNVAFIWCYEPAAPNDFDEVNAAGEPKWYPGADVIDWFSIDVFASKDISGSQTGHNGALSAYGRTLRFLDMAVAENKPVVIAESSPVHYDLSDPAQVASAWAEWFTPYFNLISTRPEILWFHYIDYDWSEASFYAAKGWKNNDLASSPTLAKQYIAEIGGAKYLHANDRSMLKDYLMYQ